MTLFKQFAFMTLFAKISAHRDERAARLAGIGLMLLAVFTFSFGDALGKFMVATYSVGELLLLRACAALLVLLPLLWRGGGGFLHPEGPWVGVRGARGFSAPGAAVAASAARDAVDAGSHSLFPGDRLSAARRCHHLLPGLSD